MAVGELWPSGERSGYTIRLTKQDGQWRGVLLDDSRNAVRFDGTGELLRLLNAQDDLQAEMGQLRRAVVTDYLTGVLNRRGLEQTVVGGNCRRYASVLFLDIDDFKQVNDSRGHRCGDAVLRQVAEAVDACVDEGDAVSRVGGDEFVVLLQSVEAEATLREKAEEIRTAILALDARISVSIGGAFGKGADCEHLIHLADQALYQVKANGKNGVALYGGTEVS